MRLHDRLILCFLLLPAIVLASGPREAQLTWEPPTEYTDGTPLEPEVKAGLTYRVYTGPCGGALTEASYQAVGLGLVLYNQPLGNRGFVVTAVTPEGVESLPSAEGCKFMRLEAPTDGMIEAPSDGSFEP